MATAGTPEAYRFDADSRIFTFSYRPDPRLRAPTVVFTAPLQYPTGYRTSVRGARIVSRRGAKRLLLRNRRGAVNVSLRLDPRRG